MPQAANIVLADAADTPVNHTFVPLGQDSNGVFWFEDQSAPSAIGFWRISVETKRPPQPQAGASTDGRTFRVRVGLHEPILANVTNSTVTGVEPAPQLAYVVRTFTEYVLPERTTHLDRKNIRKMNAALQANSLIIAIVELLEGVY